MRRGISFTMTMIVTAVILLAAAFLIISIGQSSFSDISSFFDTSSDQSETELLRQECRAQKDRLCEENAVQYAATNNLDEWADDATVDGATCNQLNTKHDLFGSSVPACDNEQTRLTQQCIEAIEEYCSNAESGSDWTTSIADNNIPANCLDIETALVANGRPVTCE